MPANAVFVDLDTEARAVEAFRKILAGRQRASRNVFGEPEMRQRQRPADLGYDRGGRSGPRAVTRRTVLGDPR